MISYELSYGLALASRAGRWPTRCRCTEIVERAGGLLVRVHPAVVRVPAAGRLPDLHDRGHRRDQPRAVRLPGGRAGAGGRVPHRVQRAWRSRCSSWRSTSTWSPCRRWPRTCSSAGGTGRSCPRRSAGSGSWSRSSALLFFYIWMRWTLPRYRYDQLMQFGWKLLLPLAVLNLLATAAGVLLPWGLNSRSSTCSPRSRWWPRCS